MRLNICRFAVFSIFAAALLLPMPPARAAEAPRAVTDPVDGAAPQAAHGDQRCGGGETPSECPDTASSGPAQRGQAAAPAGSPGSGAGELGKPGQPGMPAPAAGQTAAATSICLLIESAAQGHDLPVEFFARLIWQESRFKADAVGPLTRRGERAQGIAQFMPGTASERGLFDPFNPVAALPKSAEFLQQLRVQFGNLGLAAAAYNAGPQRVRDWLDGRAALPAETRNYVVAITGRKAEDWAADRTSAGDKGPLKSTSCSELMALLKEQPTPFLGELERRVREGSARPWGVELTAGFLRDRVLAEYATLQRTYAAILANQDPIIIASRFRSRGTQLFYQVRIGAESRAAADRLCGTLHKAGGACIVFRNSTGALQHL